MKVSNENLPDLVDFICLRLGSIKVMRCYRYRGYSVLHTDINVKLLASSVKEFNEMRIMKKFLQIISKTDESL